MSPPPIYMQAVMSKVVITYIIMESENEKPDQNFSH